jgi:hypothetical protein
MAAKTIIFKNAIAETVTIETLGLIILPNEQSDIEYEEILILEDSQELVDLINAGIVVVNNGTQDLASLPALEYLQIGSEFVANYYNKQETDQIINNIVINNIQNIEQQLIEDYYTTGEVDQKIGEIQTTGIKGAVDLKSDLPTTGNNPGDIWIVRSSIGVGGGPFQFVPDGQTGLYISADSTWEDQLGHPGYKNSSLDPKDGGVFGKKLDFDGKDDWLRFNSSSDFGEGPTLTVGAWINPKELGNRAIISRWSDCWNGWKIDIHGSKLRVSLDTLSHCGIQISSPNNLTKDEWSHVAFVYNGNEVIMYINAVAVNSAEIIGTQIDSYNYNLYIGKYITYSDDDGDDDDYSSDKYFDGYMDEIFIENRAMSQQELEHLVLDEVSSYDDEGFYKWSGTDWEFLARNTGESGTLVSHNSLLELNSGEYQHITSDQKMGLVDGEDTDLHKHDNKYYPRSEANTTFAPLNHNHDSSYYTKTQTDGLINGLNFSDISSNDSSTNVTGTELEMLTNGSNADSLHTHENFGGSGSGGLDEAYDNNSQHNQGQGRNINIDAGPVQLTASNGFAPLKLTEINYTPNQWLAGGEICYQDGDLFIYDSQRSKWLSVAPMTCSFGRSGNDRTGYMRYCGEIQTGSSYGGFVSPWDGTIVGISCNAKNDPNSYFQVGIDGGGWDSFYWGGQSEVSWDNVNINFSKNDRITIYQDDNNEKPDYPTYTLFIKRRLS